MGVRCSVEYICMKNSQMISTVSWSVSKINEHTKFTWDIFRWNKCKFVSMFSHYLWTNNEHWIRFLSCPFFLFPRRNFTFYIFFTSNSKPCSFAVCQLSFAMAVCSVHIVDENWVSNYFCLLKVFSDICFLFRWFSLKLESPCLVIGVITMMYQI